MRTTIGRAASVAAVLALVAGCTASIGDPQNEPPGGANNGAANNGGDGTPQNDWVWGDEDAPPLECEGVLDVGPSELRRLTRHEYDNTVRDLLGVNRALGASFTPDEKVGGFASNSNVPVSELAVEQFMDASEIIARDLDLTTVLPCELAAEPDACARRFITEFGLKAFRRPLTDEQIERLMVAFSTIREVHGAEDGIRVVLRAFLQSPYFLYHIEAGEPIEGGLTRLDGYSVASRLSYFLWSSAPDDTLLEAASRDELRTPEQLEAQARRMIADPRSSASISSFHAQWLEIEELAHAEKDTELYPAWSDNLRDSLLAETDAFVDHLIREDDGSLVTLFTASWSFVNYPLAELYEVDGVGTPSETWHFEAEAVGSDVGGAAGTAWNLWSAGRLSVEVTLPSAGVYRLSARVWGDQAGDEVVRAALGSDDVTAHTLEVPGPGSDQAQIIMADVELSEGSHTFFVEFLNDFYDPDAGQDRNLLVDWIEVQGPFGGGGGRALEGFERVDLDPTQRAGILTHGSVLATHAKHNQSSPVHRGKFIRERLLCQTLPQPPNDIEIVPPELDPNLSTRDRFARHSEDPACAGCHLLMDPIGVGFEHYDAMGAWRDDENGLPVDSSGELFSTLDLDGEFDGVVELGRMLAESREVRRCVALQWFRYAVRRLEATEDLCSLQAAWETFEASDFNIREYLVAIATSDAFRHRRVATTTDQEGE